MSIQKPQPKTQSYYYWEELKDFIQDKYDVNLYDYAAKSYGVKNSIHFNVEHRHKWEIDNFPQIVNWEKEPLKNYRFNKEGFDFSNSPDGRKFWDDVNNKYYEASDGKVKEIPYYNFWHELIEVFDITNGRDEFISFSELKTMVADWAKPICDLFITEFGEEYLTVKFNW